jgi:transcriptional regulator with XRE-family HTH domain
MNLKKNLKRILADQDLTAAQLSRKTGVPKTTLSEWLAGGNPRDLTKVKHVADALGLTVDQLCFGDIAESSQPIERHLEEIRIGKYEVVLKPLKKGS